MTTDSIPQLVSLGSAGAVIAVVAMFLRHIASERNSDRLLWENHLSGTVRLLQKLSDNTDGLPSAMTLQAEILRQMQSDRTTDKAITVAAAAAVAQTVTQTAAAVEARRVAQR